MSIVYYTYDAWGKVLSVTNSNGTEITSNSSIANVNPIRYRGYFYDTETGLYYCNSRYYDPQMRRFINADGFVSTGQGFGGYNMFAYCQNNPVGYMDSNGNRCVSVVNADFLGGKAEEISKPRADLVTADYWYPISFHNGTMSVDYSKYYEGEIIYFPITIGWDES